MPIQLIILTGIPSKCDVFISLKKHSKDIRDRFPVTFQLAIIAFLFTLIIGIPLGLISALKRNSIVDTIVRIFALIGVSTLGLGATPPIADWGRIVYDGAQYFPKAWWLVFYPGLIVMLVALGWNLLGDGLRDVLDPKTRRSIEFKVKKSKKGGEENA